MGYYGSWGQPVNETQLGIFYNTSETETNFNLTVEIWLKTGSMSLEDHSNDFYFDFDKNSASTYRGYFDINMGANSQICLTKYNASYKKGIDEVIHNSAATLARLGSNDRTVTVTNRFGIPALRKSTVSYDANGGTGVPDSQTKIYGIALKLSSVIPTRTGYKFKGWAISKTSTTVDYYSESKYEEDVSRTLYAVWEKDTDVKVKVDGKYVSGMMYVKKDGKYVHGVTYVKDKGTYRIGV